MCTIHEIIENLINKANKTKNSYRYGRIQILHGDNVTVKVIEYINTYISEYFSEGKDNRRLEIIFPGVQELLPPREWELLLEYRNLMLL